MSGRRIFKVGDRVIDTKTREIGMIEEFNALGKPLVRWDYGNRTVVSVEHLDEDSAVGPGERMNGLWILERVLQHLTIRRYCEPGRDLTAAKDAVMACYNSVWTPDLYNDMIRASSSKSIPEWDRC